MYPAAHVTEVQAGPPRVLAMDSIAYLDETHAGCVVCSGSHGGLSAARFAAGFPLMAVIFNDAGFGKEAAGVEGLELLGRKGIPAAAVCHTSARIGDGADVWENGVLSAVNAPAGRLGWSPDMTVQEAVRRIALGPPPGSETADSAGTIPASRASLATPEQFRAKRQFTQRVTTAIWQDVPSAASPFVASKSLCFGYDYYGDLLGKRSFHELIFLMMRGELPDTGTARLLDLLLCAVANPGPRHWATRAAMNGAVGGAAIGNCLMAGMGTLQGEYLGSQDVHRACGMMRRFLATRQGAQAAAATFAELQPELPGYGLWFGQRDDRARALAERIESDGLSGPALQAARAAEETLGSVPGVWLTLTGVFAAGCADLGLSEDQAAGLFLTAGSVGLVAHAAEQRQRQWNEYPIYWDPKLYTYEGPRPSDLEEEDE